MGTDVISLEQFLKRIESAKERRSFRKWAMGMYDRADTRTEQTWWNLLATFRDEQER